MSPSATLPERLPFRVTLAGLGQRDWPSWLGIALFLAVFLTGVLAPVLAPYDPVQPVGTPYAAPGQFGFVLGTDTIGRDVLSRTLYGIGATVPLALAVVAIGILCGGIIGTVAGILRGWVDNVLMRVADLFLALPVPLVAIAIVAALGGGTGHLLFGISLVWWPYFARIVRGEVVSLAARPHVEAARMAGVPAWRIALRHIVPGIIPTLVVLASLDVGAATLMISALSFLGLGTPQPMPELGSDAAKNVGALLQAWWIPVIPGIGVFFVTITANLAGSGARNLLGK